MKHLDYFSISKNFAIFWGHFGTSSFFVGGGGGGNLLELLFMISELGIFYGISELS